MMASEHDDIDGNYKIIYEPGNDTDTDVIAHRQ